MPNIEDLLILAADLERFAPMNDELGKLIDRASGGELDMDDLDQIAAAVSHPDYARFLERVSTRRKKQE